MFTDKFDWEKTGEGGVRLLGVAGTLAELTLPETIEGLPLTEAGPYCFAKNKFLERVSLPDTVRKIDGMAFYNCTALREVELGNGLTELGADVFMNCHNLHRLTVKNGALEKSGVRLILRQISSDLRVHFTGGQNGDEAVLLFPEYNETYDEVAPAHLFGRNIEGEGFRARQCFKDGVFEYARYDAIFPRACAEERAETLCEMSMNRLRYPVGLGKDAKERYEAYVKKHLDDICRKAIAEREPEIILFLCENRLAERADLEKCARMAAENEWAEGGAYILRLKEQFFKQEAKTGRYDFDAF